MKILLVCNYFQPKIPYGELQIGKALNAHQHQVEVITGSTYFPFPNYQHTVAKILGPRKINPGTKKEDGLIVHRQRTLFEIFARSFYLGIMTKLKVFQPDIVIVFGLSTPAAFQVALFKMFHPNQTFRFIGVDSHLPSEFNQGNIWLKQLFYAIFRKLCAPLLTAHLDKVIAVQEATQDVIRDIYGITKQSTLVSHGSDTTLFTFNPIVRRKLRQQLNLTPRDFVLIYTGKLIPSKGITILTQAFNMLAKKYTHMYLLLVGDGPPEYKTIYMNKVDSVNRSRVIEVGFQENHRLPAYYSVADVAVWPLQESLAMLDAASCALPFIANHTLGAKERISHHNALLYKKGSSQDLAQKIQILYLNSQQRKQMGRRGQQLVRSHFSWDQIALKYV